MSWLPKMQSKLYLNDIPYDVKGSTIEIKNNRIHINGHKVSDEPVMNIRFEGPLANLHVDKGDVTVNGDVHGYVDAGGDINCKDVQGYADAGGDINCHDVGDYADAGGDLTCHEVHKDVDAGGNVTCGNVRGSIDAGGNINVTTVLKERV